MDHILRNLQNGLAHNQLVGYSRDDLQYLANVVKICAKQAGIPMAGAIGVATASAGAVAVPGVGSVPGWVIGALSGFVGGTVACTVSRASLKRQLDELLKP